MQFALVRSLIAFSVTLSATPAFAEMLAGAPASKIDAGDTAWMIAATALVLMMTIPGLALFYCGMVRKKNVLDTMAQSVAAVCLVSILWALLGYTLAFSGDAPALGNLERAFLRGIGMDTVSPLAKTIPESLFIVYVPLAHWVWGGGFLQTMGVLDFAGGTVVHINAGVAGLVAALVLGKRRGYGTENLAPYDLSLAVIGTGLLWVGWFGFNGGSALGAGSRASMAIVATHLAACAGALTWMACEWMSRGKPSGLGIISGAIAGLGTITPASGYVLPWHGIVIGLIAGGGCYWACTKLKLWLGYDDSLDVFGVHGVGGVIGTTLTGVFAVAAISAAPDAPGTSGLLEGNP